MPAAARLTDNHTCPEHDGPHAHVGGPILGPGCPTVLIGGQPAAHAGDLAHCQGSFDTIVLGSSTVIIEGQPAARLGDKTAHGGVVAEGCTSVIVGSPEQEAPAGLRQRRLELEAERSRIMNRLQLLGAGLYKNAGETSLDMLELGGTPLYLMAPPDTLSAAMVDGAKDFLGRKRIVDAYEEGDTKAILDEGADRVMDHILDKMAKNTSTLTPEEVPALGAAYSAAKATTNTAKDIAEHAKLRADHQALIRRVGNVNRQIAYIDERLDSDAPGTGPSVVPNR